MRLEDPKLLRTPRISLTRRPVVLFEFVISTIYIHIYVCLHLSVFAYQSLFHNPRELLLLTVEIYQL